MSKMAADQLLKYHADYVAQVEAAYEAAQKDLKQMANTTAGNFVHSYVK